MSQHSHEEMLARAREIAAAGRCRDAKEVFHILIVEGFSSAQEMLDNARDGAEIASLCTANWSAQQT